MDNAQLIKVHDLFRNLETLFEQLLADVRLKPINHPRVEWMTASQLAEYWQLLDKEQKPRTAGILKWANRQPAEFPLPHAYMGDLLRFHRDEVDKWAKEEAERRRAQKERRRLKPRD